MRVTYPVQLKPCTWRHLCITALAKPSAAIKQRRGRSALLRLISSTMACRLVLSKGLWSAHSPSGSQTGRLHCA
jgi:hypothetical protein